MDARRVRILIASVGTATLLMSVAATPVAAACALNAPDSVDIGSQLIITGSGFPASTNVDVSLTIEGGAPDEFSVRSDASGSLQITLTPEAADAGITTVAATSGADCTVQVVVAVGVPVPTVSPEPPSGGTDGVTSGGPAPRTDADLASGTTSGAPSTGWLLASLLLLIGVGGRYATRPVRHR